MKAFYSLMKNRHLGLWI